MRAMLLEWPPEWVTASEKEVTGLIGKPRHLCAVVRSGKFFVRWTLLQLGLAPVEANKFEKGSGARRIILGVEFHVDPAFRQLLM